MTEVPTTDTLEHRIEQFLQHERQEIDTLNCLGAALEAHRRAMDELADAMRHLRENLFLQEYL
jgi:uncharacterized coiled-coil protein SlyX